MKFYFLDTSALVKRYHYEKGTDKIDKIFSEDDRAIVISSISLIEMVSALNRKKEEKIILKKDLEIVLSKFFHDAIKDFLVLELDGEHIQDSITLVLKRNIRTLDSLQLAVALSMKELKVTFVCADKKLVSVAKKEGLQTINPEI
ncbi:putative nucleic acid-binding protein, contains PIN domain [Candidatus Methanoperedens nitroreducens]|uniref:Putative nucleic acid-binding protein, contains PIN domain n=1 Tax=Candidatus Methanoperedens nitratireducens TaxID=1392998 RepID=A0A062V829_9EURY|nr:type II toxin-antitoxin system VapC family toxin [Candidatus Methanoperedens nitroreducens]KCZ71914.1 putative nucleic acid-binding protein, contains PIN domain [Candidatus Methanoperedens nitroreducens]MDJ1422111.1 type II toxin-antitoxin system VapC family toxin [Candidatus Methanoperedens sp.]